MKIIGILLSLTVSFTAVAEAHIENISPSFCTAGEHSQPQGSFAIFVFCDDALGTNIAVFAKTMDAPTIENYQLGKRFWQGQEWSYDVTSFAWLPGNQLVIATSAIYGSGSVYLLNVEKQSTQVLFNNNSAVLELESVSESNISVRYQTTPDSHETINIKR